MVMHSAEKPHADYGKQREEDFASCLSELQAGVGGQVLCFCSVLQWGAARRTSQRIAELAHENKKVEP